MDDVKKWRSGHEIFVTHRYVNSFIIEVRGRVNNRTVLQFDRSTPDPDHYSDAENPPYNYYLFYMYANLVALNAFRRLVSILTFPA